LNLRAALALIPFTILLQCSGESVSVAPAADSQAASALPEGFSRLSDLDASIQQDMRYFGSNNFLGRPVAAYEAPECILTTPAALALVEVQAMVNQLGLSLKIYDCYRPQTAVNDFMLWGADLADELMLLSYYPEVPKEQLFELGYIAERSGHSRGSTVDLTLVPLGTAVPEADPLAQQYDCRAPADERFPDNSIDMGTGYDCFDPRSHTDNIVVGPDVLLNRHLLREIMEAAGFRNYDQEWWHYTLNDEPFPDEYFDFPVR
jgi:zinc D-Ala-D-Ala dipeptidase